MATAMTDQQASPIPKADSFQGVQSIIKYWFKSLDILREAMQEEESQVHSIGNRIAPEGNRRLAVIGDAVLRLALAEHWYEAGQNTGSIRH